MQAFNIKVACAVTGATERELRYWDQRGIVRPSISAAAGRGSKRLYSFVDLVQARTAKQLRSGGLSLQRLRGALRVLKEHPEKVRHPLAELRLVTDGSTLFRLTEDPKAMQDILAAGQCVSVIAIKPHSDYVRDRLAAEIRPARESVEVRGRKYRVLVEPDVVDGGFIASCRALPGCVTDGETSEEALRNICDAIEDWHAAGRDQRLAKAE